MINDSTNSKKNEMHILKPRKSTLEAILQFASSYAVVSGVAMHLN